MTLDYVRERRAFGQPIASFQNSRFRLAECHAEIEVAQAHLDRCVTALRGELGAEDAAIAKWSCTELRAACSIAACSCTAATASWPSTRSRARGPTRA